jgi:subtilisin family serine protease
MRSSLAPRLLPVMALALCALMLTAAAAVAKPIPGHYIVTVAPGDDPRGIADSTGAKPRFVYRSALNGFAAELNDGQLNALRHNPHVESVEPDGEVTAASTQTMDAAGDPWGLDRIDQHPLPLSHTYSYAKNGAGVRVYVLDTGIDTSHTEFGGRAANMFNATSGGSSDCNGHGTHVAGTVAARTYGVAKNAYLRGVKVLGGDCSKNGTWSAVIAGLDWVRASHIKPAVANMSLGGGNNSAVNTAVQNLISAGVFVAVSAGNGGVDACTQSPAAAPSAYTAAASTKTDARALFATWSSNYGPCVDGYAPGASIKSTYLGGGTAVMSGTSMASPHVAGVGALLCSYGPAYCTPSFVTSWIKTWATSGVVTGNPAGTPNRLLWKGGL